MSISPPLGESLEAVDIYWRPGCGFCDRLLRTLHDAEVVVRLHNIWEDDAAREFVRRHNRGNETVPTVALGAAVLTNPSPRAFLDQLRSDHPDLVGAPAVRAPAAGAIDDVVGLLVLASRASCPPIGGHDVHLLGPPVG